MLIAAEVWIRWWQSALPRKLRPCKPSTHVSTAWYKAERSSVISCFFFSFLAANYIAAAPVCFATGLSTKLKFPACYVRDVSAYSRMIKLASYINGAILIPWESITNTATNKSLCSLCVLQHVNNLCELSLWVIIYFCAKFLEQSTLGIQPGDLEESSRHESWHPQVHPQSHAWTHRYQIKMEEKLSTSRSNMNNYFFKNEPNIVIMIQTQGAHSENGEGGARWNLHSALTNGARENKLQWRVKKIERNRGRRRR